MYYNWLRSFHAVAREGGFTAASKVLNIGQPTVSDQVKALEQKFGVELFNRQGRNISLTDTGNGLHEITQDIFGHEDEAIAFLTAASNLKKGLLKLGADTAPLVMELIENFQASYPDIQLEVLIDHGKPMLRSLMEFKIDVAILAHVESNPELLYFPYSRSEVVLFVNAEHPWAKRKEVRIEELAGQKCVLREKASATRQALDKAISNAKVTLGKSLEINSREAVMDGIIRGLGVGAVSELEYVPHDKLRLIRISNAKVFISFYVACLSRRENRPLIQAFIRTAKDKVKQKCPQDIKSNLG